MGKHKSAADAAGRVKAMHDVGEEILKALECAKNGQVLEECIWENETIPSDMGALRFERCVFRRCVFDALSAQKSEWIDCVFEHCTFLMADWQDAFFRRCRWASCRLNGSTFANACLEEVQFEACAARSAAWSQALLKRVSFQGCSLQQAFLGGLKPKSRWTVTECDLTEVDFAKTALSGQRLDTCVIDGLRIEGTELRGAVVSPAQACELAKLLGVVIRG